MEEERNGEMKEGRKEEGKEGMGEREKEREKRKMIGLIQLLLQGLMIDNVALP